MPGIYRQNCTVGVHFYLTQCKICFAILLLPASPCCAYCSFSWGKRSEGDHKRRYISLLEKHPPSETSISKSEATFSPLETTTYKGYRFSNFLRSSGPSVKKYTHHTIAKPFLLSPINPNIFWVILKANPFKSEIKYWSHMGNSKVNEWSLLLHLILSHHSAKTLTNNLTVFHL